MCRFLELIEILYWCAVLDIHAACIASIFEFSHVVYGMNFTVSKRLHDASRYIHLLVFTYVM